MAVMSLRWLVAVSAWLPAVYAVDLFPERPHLDGPVQTSAPELKLGAVGISPRVVTAAPAVRDVLRKRGTYTCGYVDGDPRQGFYCSSGIAECIYNEDASALGCCATTSCLIWTACVPYTSSGLTRTMDADRTTYCSDPEKPHCARYRYADPTGSLAGYTIPTCDSVSTEYTIFFSSFARNLPSTSSSSRRTTITTTPESSTEITSTTTTSSTTTLPPGPGSDGLEGGDSNGAATTSGSSTPVGAIVGGVVGGIAALALLALAIFFLMRRRNQNPAPSPSAATAVPSPGQGYMPPPGQAAYADQTPPPDMAAVGYYDHRQSMAKPPMHPGGPHVSQMSVSPSGSPPPVYPPHMQQGMAPPPQHMGMMNMGMGGTPPPQPNNGQFVPYPGPQQMQPLMQQQQPGHHVAELSTQRGDGQVHELH